jgi:hypothetical protein
MRTLLFLIAAALLIPVIAFSAEETKQNNESIQFSGEIQKIDLQSKTITLRLHQKKETPVENASSAVEETPTSTAGTENIEQKKATDTADNLKTFTFDDKTEIAALEADEKDTSTETKISDLDKGDEIKVHLNDQGLIQKIEIIAGD